MTDDFTTSRVHTTRAVWIGDRYLGTWFPLREKFTSDDDVNRWFSRVFAEFRGREPEQSPENFAGYLKAHDLVGTAECLRWSPERSHHWWGGGPPTWLAEEVRAKPEPVVTRLQPGASEEEIQEAFATSDTVVFLPGVYAEGCFVADDETRFAGCRLS